jgi:hypothetical protein
MPDREKGVDVDCTGVIARAECTVPRSNAAGETHP